MARANEIKSGTGPEPLVVSRKFHAQRDLVSRRGERRRTSNGFSPEAARVRGRDRLSTGRPVARIAQPTDRTIGCDAASTPKFAPDRPGLHHAVGGRRP